IAAALPSDYVVLENFPNPFNPATQINYVLTEERHVALEIYNLHGQRVATLVNELQSRGSHTVVWQAESFGSGVYFIKLNAGREVKMRKAVLMK
ncbi:MAG: T9SS type A sorting domain-containing protein, partial [candidate division KSB1 bacterium]